MRGTKAGLLVLLVADVAPRGNSVVCCVKFSADGKYLATGCNRAAQIFDAKTGAKTWCVHPSLGYWWPTILM